MTMVCDVCGDAVKVDVLFASTMAETRWYVHAEPRPERGHHAVTVEGGFDPSPEQPTQDHQHQWGPWWGPHGAPDSDNRYFRGCIGCPEMEWSAMGGEANDG